MNRQIRQNLAVTIETMDIETAKEKGTVALFGEKYGDVVRVVGMTDFSIELCGGTHVKHTGEIGLFKLISESAVAAGIRRVEALTAENAINWLHNQQKIIHQSAELLKTDSLSLVDKIYQLQDKIKRNEKELQHFKDKLAAQAGAELAKQVVQINGINVVIQKLEGIESKSLRTMVDDLKNQLSSVIVVFGSVSADKVNLIVGVTKDLSNKVNAGELVGLIAQQVGGKGGGRPDMAMAGGTEPQHLDTALAFAKQWIHSKL